MEDKVDVHDTLGEDEEGSGASREGEDKRIWGSVVRVGLLEVCLRRQVDLLEALLTEYNVKGWYFQLYSLLRMRSLPPVFESAEIWRKRKALAKDSFGI